MNETTNTEERERREEFDLEGQTIRLPLPTPPQFINDSLEEQPT